MFDGVATDVPGMSVDTLTLENGFWRTNALSTEVLQCLKADHCKGGSDTAAQCADGYTGPLCAVCDAGYAAVGSGETLSCDECTGSATASLAAGITFIVLISASAIIFHFKRDDLEIRFKETFIWVGLKTVFRKLQKHGPIIKATFAYFQVAGSLAFVFGMRFPPIYTELMSLLGGIFSLDFITFMPVGCITSTNFYNRLLFYTLTPIFIAVTLGVCYKYARTVQRKNKIFEVFLAMTFVILPSVSVEIFSTFACHKFDSDYGNYLKVDFSLNCDSSDHKFFKVYAGLMIIIYPIGVPLMYFYLLWSKRDMIDPGQERNEGKMDEEEALQAALKCREENEEADPTLKSLSFLYAAYEPKYWWFEVFETIRKLALTGLLVFLVPGTAAQIVISLAMCMFSMRIYSGCKPFIEVCDDRFSETAQWQLYFTLFGALAMKVKLDGEDLQSRKFFDIAFASLQIAPAVLTLLYNAYDARTLHQEAHRVSDVKVEIARNVKIETSNKGTLKDDEKKMTKSMGSTGDGKNCKKAPGKALKRILAKRTTIFSKLKKMSFSSSSSSLGSSSSSLGESGRNLFPHHCDSFDSFDESWPRDDAEHIAAPSKFDGGDII